MGYVPSIVGFKKLWMGGNELSLDISWMFRVIISDLKIGIDFNACFCVTWEPES